MVEFRDGRLRRSSDECRVALLRELQSRSLSSRKMRGKRGETGFGGNATQGPECVAASTAAVAQAPSTRFDSEASRPDGTGAARVLRD
ncbi:hypothetical protein [Burkholderia sp. AW49-1]